METKHAVYGPSTLKYRALCAGWENDKTSDPQWANEGTLMHSAYETGDCSILLTDEQKAMIREALNYTEPFERGAEAIHKEIRLSILGGLTFGTADRVILVKSPSGQLHSHMIDLKNGKHAVDDASENLQGKAYVSGVFEKFPVATVTAHFILPRRDEVTTHRFTRADLPSIQSEIRSIIVRCQVYAATKDPSMLRPSEAACQYCGAKATCPALNGFALAVAKKYAPLEVMDEVHSSQITDPQKMAQIYTAARVLEKMVESVKTHAFKMVTEQGIELPGYELRERAGARKITNPVLAYQVLTELGLDPVEIVSAATLQIAPLEEIVKQKEADRRVAEGKKPTGGGAAAIRALHAALADGDCVTSGAPTRYLSPIRE